MSRFERKFLDSGHRWKEAETFDTGACGQGTGCESDWTSRLTRATVARMIELGADQVEDVSVGPNSARAAYENASDADLVVLVHGDKGTPHTYWFPNSALGQLAATQIAAGLNASGLPWRIGTREASRAGFARAHEVLRIREAPAVLIELVNQDDGEAVAWLLANLDLVADSLARILVDL